MHPLGGADHLLATLGIGLLAGVAARSRGEAGAAGAGPSMPVRVGLAGALGLVAGMLWALAVGAAGEAVETAAAVGLLAITVALLCADRLGAAGLAAVALAVAVPHGMLHAVEGSGPAFFAGLAVSSVALFAAGAAFAAVAVRGARARGWTAGAYAWAFAWIATSWIG
jgi:hydrogenase/urease accessory protein HupE